MSDSIVVHIDKHNHLPDWDNTVILDKGSTKKVRKTIEAAYINTNDNINHREGFIKLAKTSSSIIIQEVMRPKKGQSQVVRFPRRPMR